MDLCTFREVLKNHANESRVFFYGTSSFSNYIKKEAKFIRILTDLNIARLGVIFPDIKFSKDYYFNCYLKLDGGTIISFLTKDIDGKVELDYLKNVYLEENENQSFSFIYSFFNDKYYSLSEDNFNNIKQNILILDSPEKLRIIDLLDYAILAGEMDLEIKIKEDQFENFIWNIGEVKTYLPFLELLLTSRNPYKALMFLERIGLLRQFFPFLNNLVGIEQDRSLHPEGDVFEHTLHCFQFLKKPSLKLAVGMLLHDYGKAFSERERDFSQHSTLGARRVREVLKMYSYDEQFIRDIEFLVNYHMINSYFYRINDEEKFRIFGNKLGEELLKLFKADTLGSVGKLDVYLDIVSRLKKINRSAFNSLTNLKRIIKEGVI